MNDFTKPLNFKGLGQARKFAAQHVCSLCLAHPVVYPDEPAGWKLNCPNCMSDIFEHNHAHRSIAHQLKRSQSVTRLDLKVDQERNNPHRRDDDEILSELGF